MWVRCYVQRTFGPHTSGFSYEGHLLHVEPIFVFNFLALSLNKDFDVALISCRDKLNTVAVCRAFSISGIRWLTNIIRSLPVSRSSQWPICSVRKERSSFRCEISHSSKPSMMINIFGKISRNSLKSCWATFIDVNTTSPVYVCLNFHVSSSIRAIVEVDSLLVMAVRNKFEALAE